MDFKHLSNKKQYIIQAVLSYMWIKWKILLFFTIHCNKYLIYVFLTRFILNSLCAHKPHFKKNKNNLIPY